MNGNGKAHVPEMSGKTAGSLKTTSEVLAVPLTFRTSLFEHGRQRAIDSRARRLNETDVRVLVEHAEAMAEEAAHNAFDTGTNLSDKLRAEEFERNLVLRDEFRQIHGEARRQLHAKRQELAALGDLDDVPRGVSLTTRFLLALLVGATIVLTLHDFVFSFDSEILNWLVSGTVAFLLGLAVVWVETQNCD